MTFGSYEKLVEQYDIVTTVFIRIRVNLRNMERQIADLVLKKTV